MSCSEIISEFSLCNVRTYVREFKHVWYQMYRAELLFETFQTCFFSDSHSFVDEMTRKFYF